MDEQKKQIVDKLTQATNILVTVSANPSVDQLSAAIGLTLFLNKIGKHGSAVFSGKIPSAIQFLEPQKTFEKTTDSLRDFIIALDKAKADKLRYKVEDQMVKIFITPYQTSITEKDLEFSHGDFNVEVVMALGVKEQGELDQAITAQGNILHDATVYGVGAGDPPVALGSTNWNDPKASSLSEMIASLCVAIKPDVLDAQMATAMMTGIVAETDRFSNEKTSSETMQISAKLMGAGANQQLVASQLNQPATGGAMDAVLPEPQGEKAHEDGSLSIAHSEPASSEAAPEPAATAIDQIHIDSDGAIKQPDKKPDAPSLQKILQPPSKDTGSRLIMEPPRTETSSNPLMDGGQSSDEPSSSDPLTSSGDLPALPALPEVPLLSHDSPKEETAEPVEPEPAEESADPEDTVIVQPTNTLPTLTPSPAPTEERVLKPLDSLANLEKSVDSPHANPEPTPSIDAARDAVSQAMDATPAPALPATPDLISPTPPPLVPIKPEEQDDSDLPPGFTSAITPEPAPPAPLTPPVETTAPSVTDPTAPPPVPPPMMPPIMPPTNPPTDGSPNNTAL